MCEAENHKTKEYTHFIYDPHHYYNKHKRTVYFVNIIKIGRLNLSVLDFVLVLEIVDESMSGVGTYGMQYVMVLILTYAIPSFFLG